MAPRIAKLQLENEAGPRIAKLQLENAQKAMTKTKAKTRLAKEKIHVFRTNVRKNSILSEVEQRRPETVDTLG